ncbi:hypothetical protein UlMin_032804 [Ulmus minor]
MEIAVVHKTAGITLSHGHSCPKFSSLHNKTTNTVSITPKPANFPPLTNTSNSFTHTTRITTKKKKKKKRKKNVCTISDVLRLMDALSLPVPPEMYTSLIIETNASSDWTGAENLHEHITRIDLRQHALPLLNRLLLTNVSSGRMEVARQLFDEMPRRNFISWATIIVGYVETDQYPEAIDLFMRMLYHENHIRIREFPVWIMVCLVRTCICTGNLELGKQVHGWSLKLGYVNDSSLASSLINFYGKFRCLENANMVFDQLSDRDTSTWVARLINNSREELFFEVLRDFREAGNAGIKKNTFMFSSVLKACAKRGDDRWRCGGQVHANAIKLGLDSNVFVGCGLIDMYGKTGHLGDAKMAFEMMSDGRNSACWNAMLGSFIENRAYIEAIKFLYKMKKAGFQIQQPQLDELRIACAATSSEILIM